MKNQQMKLTKIEDDDHEKQWFSEEMNHGDWCHFFVVRLEYTDKWGDQPKEKFHISINVVSPEAVAKEQIESACQCVGIDEDAWRGMTNIARSQVLIQYGTYAAVWQKMGNSERKLLKEAREKLQEIDMMFGFWMDRPLNGIGDCGWEFVTGEIGRVFKRKEKDDGEDQTEGSDVLRSCPAAPERSGQEAADGEHLAQPEITGGDHPDLPPDSHHDDPA